MPMQDYKLLLPLNPGGINRAMMFSRELRINLVGHVPKLAPGECVWAPTSAGAGVLALPPLRAGAHRGRSHQQTGPPRDRGGWRVTRDTASPSQIGAPRVSKVAVIRIPTQRGPVPEGL